MVQEMKHVSRFEYVCEIPFKDARLMWVNGNLFAISPDHELHYLDLVEKKFKPVELKGI